MGAVDGTISTAVHRDMLALRDNLLRALTQAMRQRTRLRHLTGGPGSPPAWEIHERQEITAELARHRTPSTVTDEQVYEVEQSAAGHVDYAQKFALRLAMQAYGLPWAS